MDKITLLHNSFDLHFYLGGVYHHNFACRTCYATLSSDIADRGFDHNQFYLEF